MSRMLEQRLKLAAWLLFVVLFFVYAGNADRVYHVLSGKSYVVKLPDGFSLCARGDLQLAAFDYAPVNNAFQEGKGLRASMKTIASKSGNAKVRIFFKSADGLYEVIENRQSFWANSSKVMVCFFTSTTALDNGVYATGLYLSDDAGGEFVWLDSSFEKTAGGPAAYVARPVAVAPAAASKDLLFAVEALGKDGDELVIKGWVVLDGAEMNDYNAYIAINTSRDASKTFYAPLYTRRDVAALYEDSRAANSGFHFRIPKAEITPGKHGIKVMVQSRKTGEVLESVLTETRNF